MHKTRTGNGDGRGGVRILVWRETRRKAKVAAALAGQTMEKWLDEAVNKAAGERVVRD